MNRFNGNIPMNSDWDSKNKLHTFSRHDYTKSLTQLLKITKKVKKDLLHLNWKHDFLDINYDYYLLYIQCDATEFGLEVRMHHLRKEYQFRLSMMERGKKTHPIKGGNYIKDVVANNYPLTPLRIIKNSHIHDGINMKKAILNDIGKGILNYSARKQLNKIDIKNRLYICTIHKKHGVIKLANKRDLIQVVDNIIKNVTKLISNSKSS